MVDNRILHELQSIGFSEYEAKAYMALLAIHPATAYETAREAGIPTSKIYAVLDKLYEKQVVFPVEQDGRKRYAALSASEFISLERSRFKTRLERLDSLMPAGNSDRNISYIWNVHDYETLIVKAREFILGAGAHILLSCWPEELDTVHDVLALRHDLKTAIVLFGKTRHPLGTVFEHPIEDTIYNEQGGRGFCLVVDSTLAVSAVIRDKTVTHGAWSMNSGFVTLAEDYIKHDIYIMKIVKRFDPELIETFGENYALLRDIFSNEVLK